ncbi:MAG: glycerol-3-phosphate 1-O-acyltransferase PlsY, partial [Planctomycetota bacterium]
VLARVLKGDDLRQVGSGNIGATNAMRVLGKPLGLTAFLLDFAKGLLPTLVFAGWAGALDERAAGLAVAACGTAAVVGHCFPAYLAFKGGKGVATGCGAIVGVEPLVFVCGGAVWLVALFALRYVSVASLAMGATFPVAAAVLTPELPSFVVACALLTALVVVRHRTNIARLRAGTEPKTGTRRAT